jgi:GNAT superfamily N-acetyltransferase
MTTATDLRIRGYAGVSDVPDIVRISNAAFAADGVDEVWSTDGMAAWLSHASDSFDPARDVVIAEADGRVVGVGRQEWVDTRDGQARDYRIHPTLDPAYLDVYCPQLLAELEARARSLAATHPPDREPFFGSFAPAGRPGEALLLDAGYAPVRWFIDMVRPDLEGVVEQPMPDGLELRPVTAPLHETIWRADREAFRDHWGGADESIEQLQRILDDPDTDTSLWLVAWDGDEVAGGVFNEIRPHENEALGVRRGWLDQVFTRRPWRGRGLASALIGRSLLLLRERGMTSAALGVDVDNPTGALGLYERAGFVEHDRFVAMRKPMEARS